MLVSFSPSQQQQIQKIVHDYLVNNPEVLLEASQALQAKELDKAKTQASRDSPTIKKNYLMIPIRLPQAIPTAMLSWWNFSIINAVIAKKCSLLLQNC